SRLERERAEADDLELDQVLDEGRLEREHARRSLHRAGAEVARQRDEQARPGAPVRARLRSDVAAVSAGDLAAEVEPEAHPAAVAAAGRVQAREWLEHGLAVLRRDPGAFIFDGERDPLGV